VTLTANPNFEAHPSYSFSVLADDGVNPPSEQAVSLAINNLDEIAPTITSGATATAIDENSGAGQAVYTATADDSADISAGVTFSLGGTDAGLFTIDGGTGVVTLTANPNFEAHPSYSFSVLADDGVNPPSEQAVSLAINNVVETAVAITAINTDSANGGTNNDFITNDTTLTVSGTHGTLTAAAGEKVQVSSDGGSTWVDVTTSDATTWSYTDPTNHSASFIYQARVVDNAANVGTTASQAITIDTVPPAEALAITAITTDSGAADLITNDTTLIVSGTNGALGAGEKVQISSDGSTWHDVTQGTVTAWSYDDQATTHSTSFTYQARIVDTAGNIGTTASQAITIDTTAPTVTSVAYGANDGTLKAGDSVTLTVNFSETVTFAGGTPSLTLNDGGTAVYTSGNGTSALVFTHTVLATQNTADLTVTAFNLNSATVQDAATNNAVLTGAVANPAGILIVDTTAPTVTITSVPHGNTRDITFTFSEAVSAFNSSDVTIVGATAGTITGSGAIYTETLTGVTGAPPHTIQVIASGTGTSSWTDTAGNAGLASAALTLPAGVAGEPINLALTDPLADHVGAITVTIAGVPAGWTLSEGTNNGDGIWTVQTDHIAALAITSPDNYTGALVLNVAQSWTNADGSTGTAFVADNVEVFAKGSPIFAVSADDHLTGSSNADLFVFAQPIANDTIHNFDAAADKIDLIGFAGVTGFADLSVANDANGNAVVTLGAGSTITVLGVDAAALTAGNFEFDVEPVTTNASTMTVSDGAILPLGGTIENSGTIALLSNGAETDLQILFRGATLTGGGHVLLSDSDQNAVFGGSADTVLTNADNTISGAGQLGAGQLVLVNMGTILADGTHALVIDTGTNLVTNAGTLEATGSGGLVVDSALANTGNLWANGGNIILHGDVTGAGNATIGGAASIEFGAASDQNVAFADGAAGMLKLDVSAGFTGSVSGFVAGDSLDLGDVVYGSVALISYAANDAGTGGALIVSDGTHAAQITLLGQYAAAGAQADGQGGTLLAYDAPAVDHSMSGGIANDILVGGGGNDLFAGGQGSDTMTGGAGSDTFRFLSTDGGSGDTITDFTVADTAAGGDLLDIKDLLAGSGYTGDASTLAQFVSVTQSGGNTIVSVDSDGAGAAPAQNVVTLQGVTNTTLQQLLDNHQIVT
jgi:hypothetical protein